MSAFFYSSKMETEENKNPTSKKWDISILIAFLAVLISSLSAIISFKENKIMMEQQQLFSNQQEASVWPFLQNVPYNEYRNDTMCIFRYEVTNKGVGPAIIDNVIYKFDTTEVQAWDLYAVLNQRFEGKITVNQTQNASLDKVVLAPGESHTVVTERIVVNPNDTIDLNKIMKEINELYKLEYCYCSVYGKCWFVSSWKEVRPSDKCEFRKDIR